MSLFGQLVGAAGFFLFVLTISWVFGREIVDGTLKDMWAVPVPRSRILLAKFGVVVLWSIALGLIMLVIGLLMGAAINIPGGSLAMITHGQRCLRRLPVCLVIVLAFPFALFGKYGAGVPTCRSHWPCWLSCSQIWRPLRVGANILHWLSPGLYAQGKSVLAPVSYWIVIITGLLGVLATYLWWRYTRPEPLTRLTRPLTKKHGRCLHRPCSPNYRLIELMASTDWQ